MADTKVQLGKRIRSLRRQKDYSQEHLAEQAGVSAKYLGEVERGQANTSIDVLDKIANALDITLSDLMDFGHEVSRKALISKLTAMIKEADDNSLKTIFRTVKVLLNS